MSVKSLEKEMDMSKEEMGRLKIAKEMAENKMKAIRKDTNKSKKEIGQLKIEKKMADNKINAMEKENKKKQAIIELYRSGMTVGPAALSSVCFMSNFLLLQFLSKV